MSYTPLTAFTYATADNIAGPAIVAPTRDGRENFLITGGAEPMLCMLDGPHAGDGFEASRGARWGGLVFANIEFQVDLASKVPYSLIEIPLGALVLHDGGWDIVINVKNGHGFSDARRYSLNGTGSSSDRSEDVVFTRWKALQRRGDELHDVYTFSSERKGDA